MSIIINPGTEAQINHTEANAIAVAHYICEDLKLPIEAFRRDETKDGDGWYRFVFELGDNKSEVDIPGVDPETVAKGEPWVSPRLYVNGDSWLYGYALGFIQRNLRPELEDNN